MNRMQTLKYATSHRAFRADDEYSIICLMRIIGRDDGRLGLRGIERRQLAGFAPHGPARRCRQIFGRTANAYCATRSRKAGGTAIKTSLITETW